MILDSRAEFCDAVALNTGAAGMYLIGNVIDLTKARDIGQIDEVYLVMTVDTAVGFGAAGTVTFTLASDAAAAIATDGSASVHYTSAVFSASNPLAAGAVPVVVELPMQGVAYEQYVGILQTTGVNALTAGKVNAFLTSDPARWLALPDAL